MANSLVLIPLLPFLGFLLNGLFGRKLPKPAVAAIGCAGPAAAAVLGLLAFREVAGGAEALTLSLGDWIRAGSLRVPMAFRLDRLSGVMTLVVTGVGTLIHVYSIGYMKSDAGFARFFAYLNLFLAAMLVLVLADNLLLLFLGWEGVGLCSYLLISFWYKDLTNCSAGMKAFVVNRIGDFGFILGAFLLFSVFGTFEFTAVNAAVPGLGETQRGTLYWVALLLFAGATGKSAQIPLYVWLPDAMAGPTPVSALIHAATMVTSGIYLLARLGPLFEVSGALPIVAAIGALTALLAALIALTQTDIKRVLAYSTVSQLGYMFLACGVGAFPVAVFHLVTHAFFKALLFLGAGAVIHSLHHEQDMAKMGGLLRKIPLTGAVFLAGALCLAGFPLTSGFFSKDEILHMAHEKHYTLLYGIGLVTAALTAFYTFRQVALVFLGSYRGGAAHGHGHGQDHGHGHAHEAQVIHESPPSMLVPLFILAALALGGGFLPVVAFLEGGAQAPAAAATHSSPVTGWIIGGAVAIAGMAAGLYLFTRGEGLRQSLAATPAGRNLWKLSYNKLYVDELYAMLFVKPLEIGSMVLYLLVDRLLIDIVLVGGPALAARLLSGGFRRLQTGKIPSYAAYFVGGVIVLLTLVLWAAL